jgi:hypothetical protein
MISAVSQCNPYAMDENLQIIHQLKTRGPLAAWVRETEVECGCALAIFFRHVSIEINPSPQEGCRGQLLTFL